MFGADGMSPEPKKVQGIVDMPAPEDETQLQSFWVYGELHAQFYT